MATTLAPATGSLAAAAAEQGWFDDEATNYVLGFGPGTAGQRAAYGQFLEMLDTGELFGVSASGEPAGYATIRVYGEPYRRAEFFLFLSPVWRDSLQGGKVLWQALRAIAAHTLGNGSYRLETELLHRNEVGGRVLKRFGFRPEGRRSHALWMEGKPEVTVVYRLLKREWDRRH